jgi:hypothetical protein
MGMSEREMAQEQLGDGDTEALDDLVQLALDAFHFGASMVVAGTTGGKAPTPGEGVALGKRLERTGVALARRAEAAMPDNRAAHIREPKTLST